jgi:hypothetical protein
MTDQELTHAIIGAAIEVHRALSALGVSAVQYD